MHAYFLTAPPWDIAFPSIGMPYVVGALRGAGHRVQHRDANIEAWSRFRDRIGAAWQHFELWEERHWPAELSELVEPFLEEVARDVLDSGAAVVGLGFQGTNHPPTRRLARRLRAERPDLRLVGGGHGMTQELAAECVGEGMLDAAVVGEGEHAIVELFEAWERNETRGVPGVFQRGPAGAEFGGPRPLAKLGDFPDPDFADLPFDHYDYVGLYDLQGSMPVLGSRGCTYRCTFCSEAVSFGRYRFRAAADVVDEMQRQAERHGRRKFLFMDSLVNGHHGELERMVDLLIERRAGLRWGGQARLDARLDDALLGKMARSGCQFLIFGFESGSQRVLDAMQKKVDVEAAIRVLEDVHRHGIVAHLNVIVGHPAERGVDFLRTLRVLHRVRRAVGGVSAFRLRMHAGAPMYRDHEAHGIVLGADAVSLAKERWRLSDDWWTPDGRNTQEVRTRRYQWLLRFLRWSGIPSLSDAVQLAESAPAANAAPMAEAAHG